MSDTSPGLGQDCTPVVFANDSLQKCVFQQNAWRCSQDMGKAGADLVRVLLPLSSLSARGDARPGMQHPAADYWLRLCRTRASQGRIWHAFCCP